MKELGDVVLFDLMAGLAKGKALDISQSSAIDGFNVSYQEQIITKIPVTLM